MRRVVLLKALDERARLAAEVRAGTGPDHVALKRLRERALEVDIGELGVARGEAGEVEVLGIHGWGSDGCRARVEVRKIKVAHIERARIEVRCGHRAEIETAEVHLELRLVDLECAADLLLVDRKQGAHVEVVALIVVFEFVECLSGENVDIGMRPLLVDDLRLGSFGDDLVREGGEVGDALLECAHVLTFVRAHDADDREALALVDFLAHEVGIAAAVDPRAGVVVVGVGLEGVDA